MRWMTLAGCAVAGLLAAGQAKAATEANFAVQTAGDLVALCSAGEQDPLRVAALNFCHGFVVGGVRMQQTHQHASGRHRMFCLPEPVPNRDQAIAEFVTWTQADAKRSEMKPFDALFAYLSGRYPCRRGQ